MRRPNRRLSQKSYLVRVFACAAVFLLMFMVLSWAFSSSSRNAQHSLSTALPSGPEIPYRKYYDPPAELSVERGQWCSGARHAVLTVSTNVDLVACAHFTSAILSGVSPVLVGYTRQFSSHKTFGLVVEALDALRLRDWDVVLLLDSDTLFTGEGVRDVMEEFDRRAPAHPDDISVAAVRHGEQWAPMIFHSESNCFAPRVTSSEGCPGLYRAANQVLHDALNATPSAQRIDRADYLNTGAVLARVWALREFQRGLELHSQAVPSLIAEECAQSVATGLYLDMLWNEARLGLVSSPPLTLGTEASRVNQFGLHYGLIALDTDGRVAVSLGFRRSAKVHVTGEQHGVHFSTPLSSDPFERARLLRLTETIMNNSHVTPLFSTRTVADAVGRCSNAVQLTPSLITGEVEAANLLADDTPLLTFPLVVHTPGSPKFSRLSLAMPFSGWSLALRFVPGYCAEARALVQQSSIRAVVNQSKETLLAVGTICRGHFDEIFNAAS